MDISTLGAAKSYTDSVINGLSILVGKNCEISNIEVLPNGNKITFTWWDSNNVQQSNDITVLNGEQGIQGVSITNVEINEENHLILTLSDSTIIDAGEIVNDVTNYEDLDNKPKINGIELIGNKSTSDLGIEIPTVTNDLTSVLKSNYDTAYTHSQSTHAPVNAEANVQSDWNETNNASDAFIKNKPTSLPASDVSTWAKEPIKPTYTASEIGLGNVDNTSDLDKPVSTATSTALGNKVDKVTGKGLSTNDLTNTLKSNYDNAYTHSQSAHAPSNAEANVQSDWNETDNISDAFIKNKPTSLPASDVSSWAKATNKPTYSKSEVGLSNVDNTSDLDKPVSTAMNNALALKANITDLYALGIDYDNGTSGLAATNVQTAINELNTNKATTTALTAHTGNADIHVTAADKTTWNDKYVLPTATADLLGGVKIGNGISITDGKIGSTCTTKTYGKAIETEGWYRICDLDVVRTDKTAVIMLNRNYTNTENEAYIISFCYSHNKPVFNLINSSVGSRGITKIRVVYNANSTYSTHMYLEMYYALNVKNTVSSAIFYNTTETQRFIPVNFTDGEIPSGYSKKEFDLTSSKLLSFSPVPATLTSTGTAGEIAYDTNYLYMCTATNTWKKTAWGADVYSTTETVVGTYNGKPLYRKVVDCGALPNDTVKNVTHNISNINIITSMSGTSWNDAGKKIPLPTVSLSYPISVSADKSKISISTSSDRSDFKNSNVIIEYTKTTD